MTLRLLFARHGESQWQVVGEEVGPDSELTELGRRQADHLGRWLVDHIAVNHVYASPLKRAHKTAQLAATHLGLPVHLHEGLKESWFLVASKLPAFSTPSESLSRERAGEKPASEGYQAFRSQVSRALRDILGRHDEGTILIVAHGGTIGTALRLLLGSDAFTVNVGNTTLHSLTWNGGRWHIEYIDRWAHLKNL